MSAVSQSLLTRLVSRCRRIQERATRALIALPAWFRRGRDLNRALLVKLAPRKFPTARQLRYAGTVLPPVERRAASILLAVAAVSFLTIAVRLVLSRIAALPARGGQYTEGVVGAPEHLNPLYSPTNDVDADLVRLIYSGLFRNQPDGTLDVDLAESFEISNDGKVITVKVRENLFWHDGEPLTVDDAMFTFEALKNPEWKSPLFPVFHGASVERVDERTVRFTLSEPFAPFLRTLTVGILPAHVWGDVPPAGAALAEFNQKPVGSGPFRVKSFVRDRLGQVHSYTLERNVRYHLRPPFLDRLMFNFYPDASALGQAVVSRQVDGAAFLPHDLRERLGARRDLQSTPLRLPQETAVFFNLKKNEALQNLEVRRALAAAMDRERILREAQNGEGEIVSSPVLPGLFPGLEIPPAVAYDPASAISILEGDGWNLSEGSTTREKLTKDKKGKVIATSTLAFTLVTIDRSENAAAAKIIEENWRAVGANVTLSIVEAGRIQRDIIRPRQYDALLYGEVLGADPDPYPFWHSSQGGERGLNLSSYANRTADELLEAARKLTDPAKRAEKYNEFQKLVAGDVPAVFLFRPFYPYLVDRKVKGIDIGAIAVPSDRFAGIANWYIKTRPTFRKK